RYSWLSFGYRSSRMFASPFACLKVVCACSSLAGSASLHPAPNSRQPRLLCAGQSRRPIVIFELYERRIQHVAAPGFKIVVSAVPPAVPTFLVLAVRIGAEQHAPWFQCGAQLSQDARQFLRGHVKERSVREDAVKALTRQVKPVEILLPHLATGVGARHGSKGDCSLQPDSRMAQSSKSFEVAPWPTAKIENHERRLA